MIDQEMVVEIISQLESNDRMAEVLCELIGALNDMLYTLDAEDRPLPPAVVQFLHNYRDIVDRGYGASLRPRLH